MISRRHFFASLPCAGALSARPVYEVSGRTSAAIQKAIDAAGTTGGTVRVPAGRYECGSIRLKSHVSVWLDNGAVLAMSSDPTVFDPPEHLDYDPHADRATSYFRNALFSGEQLEDIAIYGQGLIEGNRGPKPIAFKRCRRISIRDITIEHAGSYNISLLGCEYVNIDGVTIRNGYSDGIDPDCCKFVRISNCFVESVDDAICLKASPALGQRISTEDVAVTNCVLRTASIHFKCGTESYGDFRNIAVSNCTFIGGMGTRHGNPGIALYTVDGGALEGVVISNVSMQNVGVPIALRLGARGRGQVKPVPGMLQDVSFSNIVAVGAARASVVSGIVGHPIRNINFSGIRVSLKRAATADVGPDQVPEKESAYPDPTMFGELPAYGLYIRHAAAVTLRDITLTRSPKDSRAGLIADDVDGLDLINVQARPIWSKNVR